LTLPFYLALFKVEYSTYLSVLSVVSRVVPVLRLIEGYFSGETYFLVGL